MPDLQCSLWPDIWFGISLTTCCIDHDLGGSDWELFFCVINQNLLLFPVALTMLVGLFLFKKPYIIIKEKFRK